MNNFVNAKRLEIFIIVTVIAAIGVVYAFSRPSVVNAPQTQTTTTQTQANTQATDSGAAAANQLITYSGVDGQSALALLQASHQVDVEHYSFGDEVVSIDGIKPDNVTAFWEFLVNGKDSPVGASTYITKSTDTITWQVSKIYPSTAE